MRTLNLWTRAGRCIFALALFLILGTIGDSAQPTCAQGMCGDGVCGAGETAPTCPQDCGIGQLRRLSGVLSAAEKSLR